MTQCAGCHGHDGSGLTPMGRNLYPRVPSLRSTMTQALTDGELRYIIENGVPLTGMAAWGHPRKTKDGWRLVSFIRSLRPLPGEEDKSRDLKVASSAHYVGPHACETCHADEYRRWKKTPMANIVRDPGQSPSTLFPDLTTNWSFPSSRNKWHSFTAAFGSSGTSSRWATTTSTARSMGSGHKEMKQGLRRERRGLVGVALSAGQHAAPDRPDVRRLPLGRATTSTPNKLLNGTSAASGVTARQRACRAKIPRTAS